MATVRLSVIIFCVFFLALSQGAPVTDDPYENDMENRKIIAMQCIKEVKIEQTVIEKVMQTQNLPKKDKKYKQFLACSYKKQGYQSEDGKMLYDNIKKFLSRFYTKEELRQLDSCKTVNDGEDDSEMAFNHLECIMGGLRRIDEQRLENNEAK